MKLKVYIAGKINPESPFFKTHDWRDSFCEELSRETGLNITNLDPTKPGKTTLNQNDQKLIFGRDAYMISKADLVIVNLTDDISVGGSQEMLIAKYYKKPLVGLAPRGGKFNKDEKEILGNIYKNFLNPFVAIPCDKVVENMAELTEFLKKEYPHLTTPKDMSVIDESIDYYMKTYLREEFDL